MAHDAAMLFLHRIERGRELFEMLCRSEHPQRVSGRRSVDDDDGVGVFFRQFTDAHPCHQLVDARQ